MQDDLTRKFDIDLREGQATERALVHVFLSAHVEVKDDKKAQRTGNVFVEYQQKDRKTGEWKSSGMSITRAHWWAFHIAGWDRWVLIRTEYLREMADRAFHANGRSFVHGGDDIDGDGVGDFKGVLIPLRRLVEK